MTDATPYQTWDEVSADIDRLASEARPAIAIIIVENAKVLADFCATKYAPPSEVGIGYWRTMRLIWSHVRPPIELEVFEARYEFYRFFDGSTDIEEVEVAERGIPDRLLALLDSM